MQLSDLIDFRNQLEKIASKDAKKNAGQELDIIRHLIEHPQQQTIEPLTASFNDILANQQTEIMQAFDNFHHTVEQAQQRVREQIAEQEKYWFQESYRLYEEEMCYETAEHILSRRPALSPELEEIFRTRLGLYNNWQCPGLIIRPGEEQFINSLVAYDPLYIVDESYDLLKPALNRFPKQYQRRLRTYVVEERKSDIYLEKIPNDQFGMCFVYNFFNFRPFEVIKQYLQEIYTKLRPGGVLVMTYNDCDIGHAVRLVERHYACYTPGYLVRDLAESIGYEQTFIWNDGSPSVWIELRKPGTLSFLRGGQAMATVKHMDGYLEDVDFLRHRKYNSNEIEVLHSRAQALDIEQHIIDQYHPFELEMLINEINHQKQEVIRAEEQRQRMENLQRLAQENNVDTNQDGWEEIVIELLEKKRQEEIRIAKEIEQQRLKELHEKARHYGIDPLQCPNEEEIMRLIAEAIDRIKKQELQALRQRAMELQVGDPNLIKYGYSAEKLKQLISEKESK